MLRADAATARLGVRLLGAQGVRSKMDEFMPWPIKEPEPATAEQVLAFLTSRVKRKD